MSQAPKRSADCVHVLVVEDEPLLAMDLEAILVGAGFAVVGPAPSLEDALERLREAAAVEVAVLDITLDGCLSFPIADALADHDIPFLFVSGHTREVLPERHRHRRIIQKPYRPDRLIAHLRALVAGERSTLDGAIQH